jgi:hypothetical protein
MPASRDSLIENEACNVIASQLPRLDSIQHKEKLRVV